MRLVEPDRSLLAQRELESRQAAAQTIVRSLHQSLNQTESRAIDGPVPERELRLVISDSGVEAEPANRLLWFPAPRHLREAATAPFAEAEALEFQGNQQRALSRYKELAGSPDVLVRAGALLRMARVRRRAGQCVDVRDIYGRLALLKEIAINGTPADLVGRSAICSVLAESKDSRGPRMVQAFESRRRRTRTSTRRVVMRTRTSTRRSAPGTSLKEEKRPLIAFLGSLTGRVRSAST
jgi:hypothetical protein